MSARRSIKHNLGPDKIRIDDVSGVIQYLWKASRFSHQVRNWQLA